MNKMMKYVGLSLSALLLVGCSDAHVKLNDANEAVMTVGNQVITKGEVFQILNSNGAYVVTDSATKKICEIEVPITDEMRADVDGMMESLEAAGEYMISYYTSAYGSLEKYKEQLLQNQQRLGLYDKYVEENFDTFVYDLDPRYATILVFTTEDDANAALSALKDGSMGINDVIINYASTSSGNPEVVTLNTTSYDAEALTLVRSNSKSDGWAKVASAVGDQFYLIRVEEQDVANFREEFIENLSSQSAIQEAALTHYFKKHKFKVYDKELQEAIKAEYPEYLNN